MEKATTRRSDRITAELAIQVMGTDGMGRGFMDETKTLVLSRHGAKIILSRKLVPEQEITVRCLTTSKEADARVVGQIGGEGGKFYYGIEFLDAQVNVWDIDFPPLADSESAVARVLLECHHCHTRELAYLDEFEAEVFEANKCLSRHCKRCADTSFWMPSAAPAPTEQMPVPTESQPVGKSSMPAPVRSQNERQSVRICLKMVGCVRHPQLGEEIVTTENISRAGFSFKSAKRYGTEFPIEAAVPYAHGGANIFAPAQIEHAEYLPSERLTLYGVSYILVHKGWPRK